MNLREVICLGLSPTILIFAVGCGDSGGTVRGVTTLQQVAANISVSFAFPPKSGGQARQGQVGIELSFAEFGRALGSNCPIINADVQFGGVPLRAVSSGGSSSCGTDGCKGVCLDALWAGDATALLETMPPAVDLTITDSTGQLTFALDNPAPMANVEFSGLQDGQTVSQGDKFPLTIDAVPPLDQSSIANSEANMSRDAAYIYALMDQAGRTCLPSIVPGSPSAPDQWNLDFGSSCPDLTAGLAYLRITIERATAFNGCPTGATCSGDTQVDWKEIAVINGN